MPLAGTFDVLDFGEVLALLARRALTGRLHVRTASMHGTIWVADGRATSAEIGSAHSAETRNNWRNLLEDICFDALRSPRGSFEFHPEDEAAVPAGPRVRLETVVAAGRKRLQMWRDVESVIQSFEAVPRLAEALGEDSVTVSQDRWRVLVALDGRRNVAALAKRLDIELLEFCQLLKPLVESGAVLLEQPEGWLKSLPKVRLDPGLADTPTTAIDPALLVDFTAPGEGASVLNVTSTPVDAEGRPRPVNGGSHRPETPPAAPAPADGSGRPGRRRLRGRDRSADASLG